MSKSTEECIWTEEDVENYIIWWLLFTLIIIIIVPFLFLSCQIKEGKGKVKEHTKRDKNE